MGKLLLKNNVARSSFISLTGKILSAVISFLAVPLLLNKFGVTNYGIWLTINSTIGFLSFLDLGIASSLILNLSRSNNKLEQQKFIKIAYSIQILVIAILITVLINVFDFINWKSVFNLESITTELTSIIFILTITFCVNTIMSTMYSIQIGLNQSSKAALSQLISTMCYGLGLLLLVKYTDNMKPLAYITFGIPAFVGCINTITSLNNSSIKGFIRIQVKKADILKFMGKSGMFLFLQIFALLTFQIDCLLLAHYGTFTAVTTFATMAKLFSIPTLIFGIYLQYLWPEYSRASSNNKFKWIKYTLKKNIFLSAAASLFFVLLCFIGQPILEKYWIKSSFELSIPLIIGFGLFLVVNIIDNNLAAVLNGMDKIKQQLYLGTALILSNIILSIAWIKSFGVLGTIAASIVSIVLFSIIPSIWLVKKALYRRKLT